ncbi:fasciclin domain-containing protein [Gordonia rhizosphera]|uniref:FAS1 domain-containing protein n=1 Tax=Gordonia rhizosphera NBRC 16068 TaxID=1108045 RepID=K6VCA6_9ACTN|nr:fasciclin domain-containing protein [Gordonia rhizosphera]GAB93818.1 hypothetical protein GORHZ_245_00560 [Gordonia rhizosphera NBRC 16068]
MALRRIQRLAVAASGIALTVGLVAGCSDDGDSSSEATTSMAPMSTMASESAVAAAALVGPGCAAYAEANPTGPASVAALASQPVATGASNIPVLTTLTQALSGQLNPDVNLVETLNNGEFTVFAPTDDAFAKIDPATIETLKTDSDLLTSILTYHVVPGQAAADQVAGEHETVQGGTVTVTGSGDDLQVNDAAVVCGGVKTANATVYLVDTVLMPPQ